MHFVRKAGTTRPSRPSTASRAQPVSISKHIQMIMAKGDGPTSSTAFKVSSVKDECQMVDALNLKVQSQSLVMQKKERPIC